MLDLLVLRAQRPSVEEDDLGVDEITGTSDLMIKGFSRPDLVSKMDTAMSKQTLNTMENDEDKDK